MKNPEGLNENPPIHICINRINNRLVFKIKNEYKLKLQRPETMKLFASTKDFIGKTKNGENEPSLEVVEVQSNLIVDNQCQQKSNILYTFTPNKYFGYLLNVESNNLVFLKTYNTDFDDSTVTLTNEDGRLLVIEDKVNFTLLVKK